jgi:DNA-binding NarL/FixJ family response regulator
MPSVVIADDHAVVRTGIRLLIEREAQFDVVAEVGTGEEAIRAVTTMAPDLLVLDLSLPDQHGLGVVRQLRGRVKTRIVILSMHSSDAYVLEALRCGASAYVLKESAASDLLAAMQAALAGGRYVSRPLSVEALDEWQATTPAGAAAAPEHLTARERQVLTLAAEGHTNAGIGGLLGISPRTVETHRAKLMNKLGLKRQGDLIKYAVRHGLIPIGSDEDHP